MKTIRVELPDDYYTGLQLTPETARKTVIDMAILRRQNRLNQKGYHDWNALTAAMKTAKQN